MLVDATDLRDYMSEITLSDSQLNAAANVLQGVQTQLERYLNRTIELVEQIERVQVYPDGRVELGNTPIVRIVAVTESLVQEIPADQVDGQIFPVPSSDPKTGLTIIDHRTWVDTGVPTGTFVYIGSYGYFGGWVDVQYVGGYDGTKDEGLKLNILEVAARIMTNMHDDTLTITNGVATTPNSIGPRAWTEEELRSLDRLRRRVVV